MSLGSSIMSKWILYLLIHSLAEVQAVGETSVNEGLSTVWYKQPPVGVLRPRTSLDKELKIRDLFAKPDKELDALNKTKLHPTLELVGEDTGNPKFLDKKTIKYSITDLSSLSKAGKLLEGVLKSCNGVQEGPKLFFPTCPGDLVVVTIAGSMKMTCNEIEKRVFYGPVTIKALTCQQSFKFDMSCDKKRALQIKSDDCNEDNLHFALILVSLLFAVSLVVLLLLVVWFVGINKPIKVGEVSTKLKRKGCYYELEFNEFIGEDGKKKYLLPNEPSVVNMKQRLLRKHWMILLLTFLICRPVQIKGYELTENYDSTILKYNYKLTMGDSEKIDIGSDSIVREPVVYTSNLVKMFTTSDWSLDTKETYFCQWYKCEAFSVCGMSALPFIKIGELGAKVLDFNDSNLSYYTCQKLMGYCTFGNGCKVIGFEVVPSVSKMYTVYSITIGGSHGGSIKAPIGCIVENVHDKSSGVMGDYLLVAGEKGDNHLCHRDLFSAKPEIGMLGDFQKTNDGQTHFAANEVSCVADHGNKALCRYGESFVSKLTTLCERVDSLPFKVDIDLEYNLASWKQSGEAIVSMKCDRKLPLSNTADVCTDIEINVWEVAHLDSHLLLGFKASSSNAVGFYKFPKAVHMHSHTFLCNGAQQFSELYDLKSLKISGLNYTVDSVPYNSLDVIQGDHFSDSDPDMDNSLTVLSQVAGTLPFLGLSTSTVMIILVVVALMYRR